MSGSSYLVAVKNVSGLQERESCRIFFDLTAGGKHSQRIKENRIPVILPDIFFRRQIGG